MTTSERVVVTGLGVLAPNAHGLQAFAGALREGKSGIRFHPHLAEANFGCQVGGIPEGVELLQKKYLTDEELLAMNPNMIYAAIAAIDAFTDAGLTRLPADVDEVDWDTGAIIGTGIGGIDTIAEKLGPKTDQGKVNRLGSTMVEQIMSSGNSARVAGLLGFIGVSLLLHRRLFEPRIRINSKTSDIVLLILLWVQFALGLATIAV